MNSEIKMKFEEKHEKMQKSIDIYCKNLNVIYRKIEAFNKIIYILKDTYINSNLNPPLNVFDNIFTDFSNEINKLIIPIETTVLYTLKYIIDSINQKFIKSSELYNKIKKRLSKEQELNENKKQYEFDSNTKNNNKNNNTTNLDEDKKIFNKALNDNTKQIYKYQIDYIHEKIDENLIKYDKMYNELNFNLNNNKEINIVLNLFANFVKQFSDNLQNFYSKLSEKIKDEDINKIQRNKEEKNNINIENENKKNDIIIFYQKNKPKEVDIEKTLLNISQKIINNENGLKLNSIITIFDLLEIDVDNDIEDDTEKNGNAQSIFLSDLSLTCKDGIIFVKNRQNFFHLGNILNSIFFKNKSNINIAYEIIKISKHFKFKNIFLYEIILKKNAYFRTKTLWIKIIEEFLVNKINNVIEEKLNTKIEEGDESKKKDKENIKLVLKNLNIDKRLSTVFKKLKNSQIKELYKYIQESVITILNTFIPIMHNFQVQNNIIHDIIKKYRDILGINNSIVKYLETQLLINSWISKNIYNVFNKDEIITYKNTIILSEASKFLSKIDYLKLIIINKECSSKLKKILFANIFAQKSINIESHIKYMCEYLQIKKLKDKYNYSQLKQDNIKYIKDNTSNKKVEKLANLIQQDLKRTALVKEKPEINDNLKNILCTFGFTFTDLGYYQGLNNLVSFLYQLLDFDEEITFYFLCGLMLNTNYNLMLKNKFIFLNKLFHAFEKIIKLVMPEFLYLLRKINIELNYFCSSWFINLYTGNLTIIDKNNPPLLLIFFFEKFIIDDWSSLFNLGLTILQFCYNEYILLEKEQLIKYIMNIIIDGNIFDNDNFEKCKNIFEKNEKIINEYLVDKILEITNYEYENKYLINSN